MPASAHRLPGEHPRTGANAADRPAPGLGRRVITLKSAKKEGGTEVDLTLGARHALGPSNSRQ